MQSFGNIKFIGGTIIGLIFLAFLWYFYNSTLFRAGGDTPTIIVRNCSSVEPNSLVVEIDKSVRFMNDDSKSHVIKLAGNSFTVKAAEESELTNGFVYGVGTYAYDCDDALNVGQIQVASPEQDLEGTQQSFKELYDSMPEELQSCVKGLLGNKFKKVYNGQEEFVLGSKDPEAMNSCLESRKPTSPQ